MRIRVKNKTYKIKILKIQDFYAASTEVDYSSDPISYMSTEQTADIALSNLKKAIEMKVGALTYEKD